MHINKEMKMADVIHMNHHLLHVINRFGIQLGFGEKSVREVCEHYHVNLNFFLEIVNTYHDQTYFPVRELQGFPVGMLIDYLQKTHKYYLEYKIPDIERIIDKLSDEKDYESTHLILLQQFFHDYKNELTNHILSEEQRVYPYILALERALNSLDDSSCSPCVDYSIDQYEEEHDDVESKLFDLKNIIIKYMPSPRDSKLFNHMLHELFELEKDLNNHAHIEDLILVPMVSQMELKLEESNNRRT